MELVVLSYPSSCCTLGSDLIDSALRDDMCQIFMKLPQGNNLQQCCRLERAQSTRMDELANPSILRFIYYIGDDFSFWARKMTGEHELPQLTILCLETKPTIWIPVCRIGQRIGNLPLLATRNMKNTWTNSVSDPLLQVKLGSEESRITTKSTAVLIEHYLYPLHQVLSFEDQEECSRCLT